MKVHLGRFPGPRAKNQERKIEVRIDEWDTWSMYHTLALIILPMLKQLHAENHGAPFVDDEDVPVELRSTSAPPKKNEWETDENHFKRWDWVIEQMICSFEQLVDDDNDAQFHSGEHDILWEPVEHAGEKMFEMKTGPNDTHVYDAEGHKAHDAKIQVGLNLFGKYFRNLWD